MVTEPSPRLPRLRITRIDDGIATVATPHPLWVGERFIACIIGEGWRFVWGRFSDTKAQERACRFVPKTATDLHGFVLGSEYPYLDGYWGERAELVLDATRHWLRQSFAPSNAVEFNLDGQRLARKGDVPPEGATLVPGGWDHEHCSICWQTIGAGGEPDGLVSNGDWLCSSCYESFLLPHSLAFVVVG